MPYVLIDSDKLKEFDPEGKLKTLPDDAEDKMHRLESKANELLGEKKKLQLDYEEYKLDSKKKLNEMHNNAGGDGGEDLAKVQAMLDDALGKNKEWESKYNGLIEDNRNKTLEGEAARIAATLTKDTNRAKLLKDQIRGRLALDNDKFTVLDDLGKPTISSVDELTGQIKAQYPFLVDGSQATGGGAQGGSGGAANTLKKFGEYSGEELRNIRNDSPETYDRLKKEHYGS
ncbi:MAG: hypothetical protein ACN2B6_01340 [Rickettsiales bacterium]